MSLYFYVCFFFFKQKTAYEMRISDWSSDVCSSDLAKIVVGARSALFLPYAHLGVIVVDEAHETSFKQEDGVHYHARDVAVMRGHFAGLPVVQIGRAS